MSRASKKPLVRWRASDVEKPVIGEDEDRGGIDTISYRGVMFERTADEAYHITVGDLVVAIVANQDTHIVEAVIVEEP